MTQAVPHRRLGRSGLSVSALCLGTMNFGPRTPEREAFEILGRALDAGIDFIDTANQYGGALGVGTTEAMLGRWFAEDRTRQDRVVLATKVHEPMAAGANDRGLSARHIRMACDASLKRRGVEHSDLDQMHHIDRAVPIEEIWEAMDRLMAQGKITYVGSSNFPGWAIARANEKAHAGQRLGLVAEQSLYNLVERRVELEVIPACRHSGLGLIPWSPLAGGLLGGPAGAGDGRRGSAGVSSARQSRALQLDRFEALCATLGESPPAIALAWLLHQPAVAATIIGPATIGQLDAVLHVPSIVLDADVLGRIDEIFPPCGEAPEAYAW